LESQPFYQNKLNNASENANLQLLFFSGGGLPDAACFKPPHRLGTATTTKVS
jgi:hypothetical protein